MLTHSEKTENNCTKHHKCASTVAFCTFLKPLILMIIKNLLLLQLFEASLRCLKVLCAC
jgi:hypothetical protein